MDTVYGLLISLSASALDALGLNIQHHALAVHSTKIWLLGQTLTLGSQCVGTPLALKFLPAVAVSALGSLALIFNICIAHGRYSVPLGLHSILGTLAVVAASAGIALRAQQPPDGPITWSLQFKIYASCVLFSIIIALIIFLVLLRREKRGEAGAVLSAAGGLLASITMSSVSLLMQRPFEVGIGAICAVSAIAQIICLNKSLQLQSTVIVVPTFYAFYAALAFSNSNSLFNAWKGYTVLDYCIILPALLLLVAGVYLLSLTRGTPNIESCKEDPVDIPEDIVCDDEYGSVDETTPLL